MFIVMGLPRSRTAWLSTFLYYDGLKCSHEGINGCKTLDEYFGKFGKNEGDSNTALYFFNFEKYVKDDTKIIIIDKDIKSAVEYGKKHYNTDLTVFFTDCKKRLDNVKGLHIPFETIDNSLKQIWSYVTDKPYDNKRAEGLKQLNIQVTDDFEIDYESYKALQECEDGQII